MANATDARISVGLPAHPKTKKLTRRLGDSGPLHCIWLFLWAASNRSDGDLTGMTDEDLELAVNWNGEPDAFVQAMADVGFLEGPAGERRIHDWAEHNSWAAGAQQRSDKSRWAALCKQYGRAKAAKMMPDYVDAMPDAGSEHAKGTGKSANGKPEALPESANGTGDCNFGTAPSPSLTDTFPSPTRAKEESTDVDLSSAGGGAAPDDHGSDDGAEDGEDLLGKVPKKAGPPPCPHMKIIELFHEVLPELPAVCAWNETRQRKLGARWKERAEQQDLAWWKSFFEAVRDMPWLMGQRNGRDGRPFRCTLEWLVSPTNFAKVIEGFYVDGGR